MRVESGRLFFGLKLLGVVVLAGVGTAAVAQTNAIFTDGFESGDLSAWSVARAPTPGSLAVNTAAAMDDTEYGLEVRAGARAWVASRHPDRESQVYVSFFFDPDNWEMLVRARVEILRFNAQGGRHHLRLVLQPAGADLFRLGLLVRGNRGGYHLIGSGLVLPGQANLIEVEWLAASSPNGTDGTAALWINEVLEAREPSLANGRLDVRSIQLGLLGGNTRATRGSFYLDQYESFRTLAP